LLYTGFAWGCAPAIDDEMLAESGGSSASTNESMSTSPDGDSSGDETFGPSDSDTSSGQDSPCGNGQLDADEACDDGNAEDGDGCNAQCTVSGQQLWRVPLVNSDAYETIHSVQASPSTIIVTGWRGAGASGATDVFSPTAEVIVYDAEGDHIRTLQGEDRLLAATLLQDDSLLLRLDWSSLEDLEQNDRTRHVALDGTRLGGTRRPIRNAIPIDERVVIVEADPDADFLTSLHEVDPSDATSDWNIGPPLDGMRSVNGLAGSRGAYYAVGQGLDLISTVIYTEDLVTAHGVIRLEDGEDVPPVRDVVGNGERVLIRSENGRVWIVEGQGQDATRLDLESVTAVSDSSDGGWMVCVDQERVEKLSAAGTKLYEIKLADETKVLAMEADRLGVVAVEEDPDGSRWVTRYSG
ncbi:MAG: hypothetical protein AAGA54_32440, partial [Myxococcota bacterium]